MEDPRTDAPGAPITPRWHQRVAVWGFVALIAVPVAYAGVENQPLMRGLPRTVADVQNISCLFSTKPDGWVFFYFQVQREGSQRWDTLETSSLAGMRPFGYRSRLHRYLVSWRRREGPGTREMARWMLSRFAELEPGQPLPSRGRIAQGWTRSSVEEPPAGRWNPPAWRRLSPRRRRVIAEYAREELVE